MSLENTELPDLKVKLTQFSHGYGCGCKIAPQVLDVILKGNETKTPFPGLLVGNESRDDAAVMDMGNGIGLISTTDFFMPIVDDPFHFGRIAATNAISDVYAMGGTPSMAVAILGWPIDKLAPEIAAQVVAGGRSVCEEAGIPLAGGHSIDSPEPIFGLAVSGFVDLKNLKKNNTANEGDLLFLTKPIGVGIFTTASKKELLSDVDLDTAITSMSTLNKIGAELGKLNHVHALTDVTGFGLFGHLIEMAEGSGLSAEIDMNLVPELKGIDVYLDQYCIPAITYRNWNSYGEKISEIGARALHLGCDPQTSGGLLIAVHPDAVDQVTTLLKEYDFDATICTPIGKLVAKAEKVVVVKDYDLN